MRIEYIIEKSPVPILFIDTFALIDYGKCNDERTIELLDIASQKVREGKLICPTSDQIEEVDITEYTIIKNKAVSSFYDMKFNNRTAIRQTQLLSFLKHYREMKSQIIIPYDEGFAKNPVYELKRLISSRQCIYYDQPFPQEITGVDRLSRNSLVHSFTNWHQGKGKVDFEQEISEYPKAKYQKIINIIKKMEDSDSYPEGIDYWLPRIEVDYGLFKKVFTDGSTNDYLNFIESDWYRYIPWQNIAIHIVANFYSKESKKPMGNGEPMDIHYISTYMPYCNYMLVDFEQYKLLKKFKLDELYKTQVFAMKTYKDLLEILKRI